MKKIVVFAAVITLMCVLAACSSNTYKCPDNGATLELLDNGGSVKITEKDGTVHKGNFTSTPIGLRVGFSGSAYYIQQNGSIVHVMMEWDDPYGLAGYYKQ